MAGPWLVLRHIEHEHLGTLAAVLQSQQLTYRYVDVFRAMPVPATSRGLGGVIAMGGPMGVYEADKYPFIQSELRLLRDAAESGIPVIGICLGAQMIAAALGARVSPGHGPGHGKEIGWYPVRVVAPRDEFTVTLPASFTAFHWHGDTFDVPVGATRLFESDLYPNQGFRWGANVLALQFHFEVDRAMIADWMEDSACVAEAESVEVGRRAAILNHTRQHGAGLEELSARYFSNVLKQLAAR
ncbi:MAG: hypothetical protein EXQ56_09145 [Acidobacteria bacterium]|nr:hypothetical protein [Acidobacteriota bacterium]